MSNSRLGGVEFSLSYTSELLPTLVADHGPGYFTLFQRWWLDAWISIFGCGCWSFGVDFFY
jgi:hypothetical protein